MIWPNFIELWALDMVKFFSMLQGVFYSKFSNYLQKQYKFKTPEIIIRINKV